MRKKQYRSVPVKSVKISQVCSELAEGAVHVGVDVAKKSALVVVRDSTGRFQRPWKVKQPDEVREVTELLKQLAEQRPLVVAMESTGTYGDALRQALTDAGLAVHRVSAKATFDYAEVFDGVPSNHDGKDAAIIAELAAIGKSTPWPMRQASTTAAQMQADVQWMDTQQDILRLWQGRLEALMARHWPELLGVLGLGSVTLLRLLIHYGGPAGVAADAKAAERFAAWGGRFLSANKIKEIVETARTTVGVRMSEAEVQFVQRCAAAALKAHRQVAACKRRLKKLAEQDSAVPQEVVKALGAATACVLQVTVGDPRQFHCGDAYRKAMGLNLKERSSGKHQGKLKITKRGSSLARRWLYFAALRGVQKAGVRPWFEAKKRKDQDRGTGAVVAVMRKLALAVHASATRNEPLEWSRLFPGHRSRTAGVPWTPETTAD